MGDAWCCTRRMLPYILRLSGLVPEMWLAFAILPLTLIPTSFGYAINRYKLADVDVIFKRGVTYTLATASVVTMIFLTGELLGSGLEPVGTVARVGVTIIAALLFSPIKDQFQIWLDKLFYGERYSARHTIVDFGRTLGAEVRSENLLDRIVDRVSRAFSVDRAGVFVESMTEADRFLPAFVKGVEMPANPALPFLRASTEQPYVIFQEAVLGFHYFIPCRVKNRAIAYIALGQTRKGDYLNSEDLELLEAMSDYVGIALENSRLYKSLEQRAAEYHDLKDFSENIIESINVGVVVEDVNGRMAGWNKALENMTGLKRDATVGRPTGTTRISYDQAAPHGTIRPHDAEPDQGGPDRGQRHEQRQRMLGEQEERHHRVRHIPLGRPQHRVAVDIEGAQGDEGGRQRRAQPDHGSASCRRGPAGGSRRIRSRRPSIRRAAAAGIHDEDDVRRNRELARPFVEQGRGRVAPGRVRSASGRTGCAAPRRRCRCRRRRVTAATPAAPARPSTRQSPTGSVGSCAGSRG